MAKYDKEKNLVSTEFLADEKKRAEGLNGPQEILDTFIEILKMFNPSSIHNDCETQGGISAKNIRNKSITEECLSDEITNNFFMIRQNLSALFDALDASEEHISDNAKKIDLLEEKHIQEYNMIISRLNEILTLYVVADAALKKEIEEAYTALYNEVKNKVDKIETHSHENKSLLDGITKTDKENFEKNTEARHTHDNAKALSSITQEMIDKWNDNLSDSGATLFDTETNTAYEFCVVNGKLTLHEMEVLETYNGSNSIELVDNETNESYSLTIINGKLTLTKLTNMEE